MIQFFKKNNHDNPRKKYFFSKENKHCNSIYNPLNTTRWNGVKNRPKIIDFSKLKLAGKTYNPSNQDQANPKYLAKLAS